MEYKRSGWKKIGVLTLCVLLCFGAGLGGGYLAVKLWGGSNAGSGLTLNYSEKTVAMEDEPLSGMDAAAESVVEIVTTAKSSMGFMGMQNVSEGAGSGVIITADGSIVTNHHVIEDADTIQVRLRNGETYKATLAGTDEQMDIALIKIDAANLKPATIGSSKNLRLGDNVYVIGNPLGRLGGTVTRGIVSALDREITLSGETMNLLQTDAAVNPGNSGGGMFDANGNLVGIVVAKTISTDVEGLGFAIPMDDAAPVLEQLQQHGYVTGRAYMGITMLNITDAQTMMMYRVSRAGVYILEVEDGSGAQKAGLMEGDCILKIDGKEIKISSDVNAAVDAKNVGDTVTVTLLRREQEQTITVTLGEYKPEEIR